ncbi:MAG: rifampicin phosphotransferase [Pseudonocardiales bacterium]|nr:rifampicin phosphotransferase [Pseudonocardiales bacterium]MDT7750870.1 rifampicin phosphotransferase [Pseudonocardiales bacterium]
MAWSTVNASEALPGVVTPLTWGLYGDGTERPMRGAFADLGVLRESEAEARANPEDRLWDLFYGRPAANLNTFRALADRTPGTSGNAIEHQLFGQVRPGMRDSPSYLRYPVIAVKAPYSAARVNARLRVATSSIAPWWHRVVTGPPPPDLAAGQALIREAVRRFEAVMRPHTLAALICQGLYEQVRALASAAGRPGAETSLVTGYGAMAETAVVSDLWDVSRDRLALDTFLGRHGYHGPAEGELAAHPWRVDRAPLHALLKAYRDMPEDRDPRVVEAQRTRERLCTEADVLAAVSPVKRPSARLTLRLAARFFPLRGVGKGAFLQCADVVRFVARAHGDHLAAEGVLADPSDVFLLTMPELLADGLPADIGEQVSLRAAQRRDYLATDLPDLWEGMPERIAVADPNAEPTNSLVTGTPVSPGVVEGIVRLVLDPAAAEPLEPDEVLVCRTTDPSWASAFMLASALVIDIGGAISHGAIVARELGIPCVIGTRTGTAALRTGDRVRVDGGRGEVHVLQRRGG